MKQSAAWVFIFLSVLLVGSGHVDCDEFSLSDFSSMLESSRCSVVKQFVENDAISKFKLRFYYGPAAEDFIAVPLEESTSILNHPKYNKSSPMIVYMTGWRQKLDIKETQWTAKLFVEKCNCNFITIDWTSVSTNPLYHMAVAMTPNSGKALAPSLDALIDAGATLKYICGISLGGQGVGHVARNMKNRVKHAIVFDPAGPLFYEPLQCVPHVSAADADCVEVIHTDRGQLGAAVTTGTMDYWVNGGPRPQPGCVITSSRKLNRDLICSHARSQVMFMETLADPMLFPSRKCSSWASFTLNLCSKNSVSYIGQCNAESEPGDYYLRTSNKVPFGLKMKGASPLILPKLLRTN